jgi:hypothetical protein
MNIHFFITIAKLSPGRISTVRSIIAQSGVHNVFELWLKRQRQAGRINYYYLPLSSSGMLQMKSAKFPNE